LERILIDELVPNVTATLVVAYKVMPRLPVYDDVNNPGVAVALVAPLEPPSPS